MDIVRYLAILGRNAAGCVVQVKQEERDFMDRVAQLGCIACQRMGYEDSPAQIHHLRALAGMGQRSSHFHVIPLCVHHHTGDVGIHTIGRRTWEETFGEELDLYHQVLKMLDVESLLEEL